jgi:superfamily I DNA and/or RNA helicase
MVSVLTRFFVGSLKVMESWCKIISFLIKLIVWIMQHLYFALLVCPLSCSPRFFFEILVIDEAANLKECDSMIPLKLPGFNNLFLVGDDKQLESVVKSKVCLRYKIIHSFLYFTYLLILYPFCCLLDCKRPWVSKKPLQEIGSNWLPKALAKCAI